MSNRFPVEDFEIVIATYVKRTFRRATYEIESKSGMWLFKIIDKSDKTETRYMFTDAEVGALLQKINNPDEENREHLEECDNCYPGWLSDCMGEVLDSMTVSPVG